MSKVSCLPCATGRRTCSGAMVANCPGGAGSVVRTGIPAEPHNRALTIEPKQPLVLASRAIVHFECGRCSKAAGDLDLAVKFAPQMADLYLMTQTSLAPIAFRPAPRREASGAKS